MVQTKHQKSKPRKQSQVKKHGKQGDISDFRAQLDLLGLKIIQVTSDGNCFFRALADQLEGNEEEHEKYRQMVVQYIVKNREMFEPFIEDEVPFDDYCQSMEKDGTWAGHMELQAASLVTHTNFCIHRHLSPRWYIQNFEFQKAQMIHLSYHDGEHYNSVRLKEDPCNGPAKPILIKADVNLTASSELAKSAGAQTKARHSEGFVHEGLTKVVMAGSGCADSKKVEQVLLQVDGDVDAAIEFLIAEQVAGETVEENDICHENTENDYGTNKEVDRPKDNRNADVKDIMMSNCDRKIFKDDKKIPRNKFCPCGSKKKYKACCGAASGKTCSKVVMDKDALARKGRRGKEGKKVIPASKAASCELDNVTPDMGALCI